MVKSCKEKTILPRPSISGIAEMYSVSRAGNHFCHLLLPSPLTIYRICMAFNKVLHTHTQTYNKFLLWNLVNVTFFNATISRGLRIIQAELLPLF